MNNPESPLPAHLAKPALDPWLDPPAPASPALLCSQLRPVGMSIPLGDKRACLLSVTSNYFAPAKGPMTRHNPTLGPRNVKKYGLFKSG